MHCHAGDEHLDQDQGSAPHPPRHLHLIGWCWRRPATTVLGCHLGCANDRSLMAARRRGGEGGSRRRRLKCCPSCLTPGDVRASFGPGLAAPTQVILYPQKMCTVPRPRCEASHFCPPFSFYLNRYACDILYHL
jgi:hypothetical protein